MSIKGVLRGLIFQKHYPQTKLERVIGGPVIDVAVDLRANSPTFVNITAWCCQKRIKNSF